MDLELSYLFSLVAKLAGQGLISKGSEGNHWNT